MKIEKMDGSTERRIAIAMVVDKTVLGRIATKWIKGGLFKNEWANIVGGWAVKYFNKYGDAPKKSIEGMFESWAQEGKDKATVGLVEKFLSAISDEYKTLAKESNSDYITDLAATHFNKVAANKMADAINGHIDNGEVDKAIAKIHAFGKIEIGVGAGIDVMRDEQAIKDAFESKQESLIEMPGVLGDFFGYSLERDGFISLLGPEKRGKCIHKDMMVPLANGEVKTIEEMVKEECKIPILSFNEKTLRFESVKVSDFWSNGKKDCWEVTTRTGRKVITTKNHEYLTPDGWKYLEDISVGDFIATPKKLPFFGNDRQDEDIIKFVAYMIADGCCRHKYGATFTKNDPILVSDFKETCSNLGIGVSDLVDKGSYGIHTACVPILKKFELFGKLSKEKHLPHHILKCPRDQIALFLKVYFSCDGYRYKDRGKDKIGITSASKKLIDQISHLLLRFGIVHKVRDGKVVRDGKTFLHWEIFVESQEAINTFLSEIGMMSYKNGSVEVACKQKSFLDKFPYQVVDKFLEELQEFYPDDLRRNVKCGMGGYVRKGAALRKAFGGSLGGIRYQLSKKLPIMRQSFSRFRDRDNEVFVKYMESDVLWDEVVSISYVGKHDTYDLTVPKHHNFVANDCIVHNSFVLMDFAWRAMLQRRKVAFFAVGDMSQNQMMRRFMIRAAKRPMRSGTVKIPKGITFDLDTNEIVVDHDERVFEDSLDWRIAFEACKEVMEVKAKSRESLLRLSTHPNSTLNVQGINSILQTWDREEWSPDIIVIDYADILAPPTGVADTRDQINMTWKQLRSLSQSRHCLVLTATQADAASYKAETLGRSNFSEDKRKYAHVTGMIGLNATAEEKDLGVMRLNWIVRREEEYSEGKCVVCAGCLAIGNPFMKSVMR